MDGFGLILYHPDTHTIAHFTKPFALNSPTLIAYIPRAFFAPDNELAAGGDLDDFYLRRVDEPSFVESHVTLSGAFSQVADSFVHQ